MRGTMAVFAEWRSTLVVVIPLIEGSRLFVYPNFCFPNVVLHNSASTPNIR